MKTKKIASLYRQKNALDDPLLIKVLASITDFGRKMDLKSEFKKIKEIYNEYTKEVKNIFDEISEKYCNDINNENENNPDWIKLVPKNIQRIPPSHLSEYQEKIKSLNNSDVKVNISMKFTAKEIELSKIDIIEMEILEDFIDWTTLEKPKPKLKNKKKP